MKSSPIQSLVDQLESSLADVGLVQPQRIISDSISDSVIAVAVNINN